MVGVRARIEPIAFALDGADPRPARRLRLLTWGLFAVHLVQAADFLFAAGLRTADAATRSDPGRFYAIATRSGRPYVDFDVEYPAGFLVLVKALAFGSFPTFVTGIILVAIACDVAIAVVLRRRYGLRAVAWYLAVSIPLLPLVLTRLDLVPTALALVALSLAYERRSERTAGFVLAIAALVKVWPALLVLAFLATRRFRAVATFALTAAIGGGVWLAMATPDAVRQVFTFRGARGWQIESVAGNAFVLLRDASPVFAGGAWRVGDPPGVVNAGFTIVAVVIAAVAAGRLRHAGDAVNIELVAAVVVVIVGATLLGSTLLSPQFMVWLSPFVVIARGHGGHRLVAVYAVAVVVTATIAAVWEPRELTTAVPALIVLARNCLLVAMVAIAMRSLRAVDSRQSASS